MRLVQCHAGIQLLRKSQLIHRLRKAIAHQSVDQLIYLGPRQVTQIYEAVEQHTLGWRQPL